MKQEKSKSILGILSIFIILHHISQKTCAPWLSPELVQHGLEPFLNIGYLCVAPFFFFSGYGLRKSYLTKENYLDNFLSKRLMPLLVSFFITNIFYALVYIRYGCYSLPSNPYSWYVFAILLFYVSFYYIFKKLSKGRLLAMALVIGLYIIFCYLANLGTWWINTAPIFLFGLIYAGREETFERFIDKKRLVCTILFFVLTVAGFVLSIQTTTLYRLFHGVIPYELMKIGEIACQMSSSLFFSLFLIGAAKKLPVENKVTRFLGNITLETYLIHGLFVQIFSRNIADIMASPFTIPNQFLYLLAVIALTLPLAWGLHKLTAWIVMFLQKSPFAHVVWGSFKRFCKGFLIFLVVLTVFMAVSSASRRGKMEQKLMSYAEENITYTQVDGKQMASFITGSGEQTILLLHSPGELPPTLSFRPLAEELSNRFKVIVPDFFGEGFSDDTNLPRTNEQIVKELHSLLQNLGEEKPVILVTYLFSSVYAQVYADMYPEEVAAVVCFDAVQQGCINLYTGGNIVSAEEFDWNMRRSTRLNRIINRFLYVSGYNTLRFSTLEMTFSHTLGDDTELLKALCDRKLSTASNAEIIARFPNLEEVAECKFSPDLPVLFLLDDYLANNRYGGIDWKTMTQEMISNSDSQSMSIMNGNPNAIYYQPKVNATEIKNFLASE